MRRARVTLTLLAIAGAGCGVQQQQPQHTPTARVSAPTPAAQSPAATVPRARPQAVEPVAGAAPAAALGQAPAGPAGVTVGTAGGAVAQPVSDATVRKELMASGMTANSSQATVTPELLAIPPIGAPAAVQQVIEAGNQIARLPYRYGGGHVTYEDTAYDCSGSISFVFEAAHLLQASVASGALESWGDPGPGKWITVFANAGHTFMYVAGLRFDTVALAETGSRWSTRSANEPDLRTFVVRHPPGL